ncbi:MAG: glycosyltransferase [Calditrichaeota bacterium]|nr:MAG: glycosyltransferase [Calditrichota bacterium]
MSVIIPTFNRADWISGCIDSVLNQTMQPDEIIVVDDGSDDKTAELLKQYPTVKTHFQKNKGPSSARNLGAEKATGEWLAFLDSDDQWTPEKLQKQHDYLCQNPTLKVVYTDEIWIRNGRRVNQKKKHQKHGGSIYRHCLPLCIISPSSILIEKKLFFNLGCFDENLPACEDYDLWLRLALREKIGFLDEPLIVKNGGHVDQLSRQWGLDKYRVIALEKILDDPDLQGENRHKTLLEVIKRCQILILGYTKHGNLEEANKFKQKITRWQSEIDCRI